MPKILIEIDTDTQVVVPRVPTVSSAMKSKFMGEFSWSESLEDGEDEVVEHVVPWWVCKEIFHRMAQHWIAAAPQPAPIPTGWQPIETAPEGAHVLVHYAKHITDLDTAWHWGDDDQRTFVAMRSGGYWIQSVGIGESGIVEPTHWMPLPPAPGGEG